MSDILRQWIEQSQRVVVFTGAGISTESGIPDFRSPGGLWTRNAPIDFRDFLASEDMRIEAWRRKFTLDETMMKAKPNQGHGAIARWVRAGKVSHIITQNIDGLHQLSGISPEQVIELHGNGTYAKCLTCSARHELDAVRAAFEADACKKAPRCTFCDGLLKSATISFGQAMPEDAMVQAEKATEACDLFLSVGSSLQVYPAAGFPLLAKRGGARLVIVNRETTGLDDAADLVLHTEIGPALAPIG